MKYTEKEEKDVVIAKVDCTIETALCSGNSAPRKVDISVDCYMTISYTFVVINSTPKPKHGSSDGRAGASRSNGPEFESRSGSYETCFKYDP